MGRKANLFAARSLHGDSVGTPLGLPAHPVRRIIRLVHPVSSVSSGGQAVLPRFGWVGFVLCLLLRGLAWGAATPTAQDFFIRVWQTEHGLPQNAVSAIVQTRDG